ncbi:MAG: phosphoribosylformylglycinamidine synthase [SAR86 cluster bacterium]|nr:phosphoribosylformylglycinamidine synthase [SAR86 cluster bacterium]
MSSYIKLNSKTLAIYGESPFTDFRLKSILNNFHAINPDIFKILCREVFFLEFTKEINSDNLEQDLFYVLGIKKIKPFNGLGNDFYIFPRKGTISSWSSKATDILHNANYKDINRVERGIVYSLFTKEELKLKDLDILSQTVKDKMTEEVFFNLDDIKSLFLNFPPKPSTMISVHEEDINSLEKANLHLGLALNSEEIEYLFNSFKEEGKDPTDAELMMFAQANSEHCRHKIFNAEWYENGLPRNASLFDMIKNTYQVQKEGVLSAYEDNAAVLEGHKAKRFYPDPFTKEYSNHEEYINIVVKVETHNHPTAIAPFPGAATGSGGEIRDEGATGKGAKPKAGLTGFSVSNLRIPGHVELWEGPEMSPNRIANPLQIMLEAPIGAADFNNEFGRPNILGYFRCLETDLIESIKFGYHKPIMLAGGLGNIRQDDIYKNEVPIGSQLIVLGGPAMLIGLGGGSASSLSSGLSEGDLDFASVQRDNAEMERRCQEVLDNCWQRKSKNPILFIHDVGAGGLSNALPELIKDSKHGGKINLRDIPNSEPGMSPMEIWCNESQERYVIALDKSSVNEFLEICSRERCPVSVVGEIVQDKRIQVYDKAYDNYPIDISLRTLFGNTPKTKLEYKNLEKKNRPFDLKNENLSDLLFDVLRHPSVASKNYLITIGDRTITGLVARDQLVGPWQVPVADNALTLSGYDSLCGEAMSIGEKSPFALSDAAASARMSAGEAVTNILSSGVQSISDINFSANWMGALDTKDGKKDLYDAVEAIGMNLCPKWGITVPVGKDSLSMNTKWTEEGKEKSVVSPLSLVISAFSKIKDVSFSVTPQLENSSENTRLLFIDLGKGKQRMGGSIAGQVKNKVLGIVPDVEVITEMPEIVSLIGALLKEKKIFALHDRSDGGLVTCLAEMSFAGRLGMDLDLSNICSNKDDLHSVLFNEELGFVMQVLESDEEDIKKRFSLLNMGSYIHNIGAVVNKLTLRITYKSLHIAEWELSTLLQEWSKVSFWMQSIRDNPSTAESEFKFDTDQKRIGLSPSISFKVPDKLNNRKVRPAIAILREQGVNGHQEMAAAFTEVGFRCIDLHMTDLIEGRNKLQDFQGLVACGGFSYGDVLGAGRGWAMTILKNPDLKEDFEEFFNRDHAFSLGVCNGCQMMANLSSLIPGAENWPKFTRNKSEKFESRLIQVAIQDSKSLFFQDMNGSVIPVPVAHGEGRPDFSMNSAEEALNTKSVPMTYCSSDYSATESYPDNPNGAVLGIAALTNKLGNSTIMMPHPERAFLSIQHSWAPKDWGIYGPWIKFFQNARDFIG